VFGSFYLEIPAAKWAIRWEGIIRFFQESCMSAMDNKPNEINKQDKDTDTHYQDKQAMGVDQKLFEPGYQKVCNDENDDGQDNKNE
jgi:hypothetical protein